MSAHARTRVARLPRRRRRRRSASLLSGRRLVLAALALLGVAILLGAAFAGSPARLAAGVSVAGVDVGGMTPAAARSLLERRAAALVDRPVPFTAGGRAFRVTPDSLGVRIDWDAALAEARSRGAGAGILRGFRRIGVRVLGADVAPQPRVFRGALELELARIAKSVDRPRREPSVRLRGLTPYVVTGRVGVVLDRKAAGTIVVGALASLERSGGPVALPVRRDVPKLTAAALAPAAAHVRTALAAPVRLTLGPTRLRLSRARIAQLLELPADGRRGLRIGGLAADRWLARLGRQVDRAPADAGFAVNGRSVRVVPAKPGFEVDGPATAKAVLRAVLRHRNRVAPIVVAETPAKRTTADARAMGIGGLVSSYTTVYGGEANRIHNVQLVAHLVDRKLIPPGKVFSFNGTTGERSAAKGFLEAPVIINGEVQTGLGGGVCQVSTTVFNAAFDAGLKILERTNHALYISHYPQGRDATVNYPDVDMKFLNDTGHWLLLRTFVGPSELTVSLYGTPTHRRVESVTSPLVVTGPPPVQKTVDPSLDPGEVVVDDGGQPSRSTSVRRTVYTASGKLLYDNTWYSSYRAEPRLVRVGPKPKPAKKARPATGTAATTGTSATGTTATTTTAPAQTSTTPRP